MEYASKPFDLHRFSIETKLVFIKKKLPNGAMIAPLILSLDKTQLTQFQGDKKAWPVYLTISDVLADS